MAFTTRSFSFASLSNPSSSPSPYSLPTTSKSRSKPPKHPRKVRSKPNRNYPKEQEQELLTAVLGGGKEIECPCPSCTYPDIDSGGGESSSSSSSSFDSYDINSEESLNGGRVENGGGFFERRKGEARESELKMKWGLAWLRGRRTGGRGCGYGYGYGYGEISNCAEVS